MRQAMKSLVRRLWSDRLHVTWLRDTRRMRHLVGAFRSRQAPKENPVHVGVVLTPWCGSAVPWFSLACGLFLADRGNRVTFIVDDLPFGEAGRAWRFQLACIRSVLKLLEDRHDILSLRHHARAAPDAMPPRPSIDRLASLNVVWAQRGELAMSTGDVKQVSSQLRASDRAIAALLGCKRFDALFVPGGVWGSSGLWLEHARAAGIRVSTYDSGGYGMLLLAADGIACQLQDIPRAYSMLKAHAGEAAERTLIANTALLEIGKRKKGIDRFSSQVQATHEVDPSFSNAVLMALNSPWDSAALGLHAVFDSTHEWIVATARFLLEHTTATLVIRQHPVERLEIARSSDNYRELLAREFGAHPRLRYVAAEDPVNSYELLEQVAAVVVYTSTFGIEAAAHGKPVVTESRSYYADLGFVRKASTLEQYHEALLAALDGRFVTTPAMRDDALTCYYVTQCCNWVFTPFNVPGFSEWNQRDLQQLADEPSVRTVVRAVEEDIPVAYLNHLARLEQSHATP
jgi:putative intracellular protease/amidase